MMGKITQFYRNAELIIYNAGDIYLQCLPAIDLAHKIRLFFTRGIHILYGNCLGHWAFIDPEPPLAYNAAGNVIDAKTRLAIFSPLVNNS